ncbi:30S ribosomal protein S21 [Candidatus Uhrbacteria bacterium CG22_combo_CG10-13_8_21_14_all_47_17]|uniref:30S ribosomal protein S21 n=1 Tax=Candidatus Uhrbacteria bacterium CG22_combo_CG10-13_8_21_14_all_47_17 TaxID=1975041 RepID=A0A2H0BSM9_9BACT|nr:MAG: 30S ribosomal protein S21 [Candidatus Uhrbacteria bacterium CG22_combo_CG10-13_8_21_14_all_47_17]
MIEVKRKKNESFDSLLRRFSRRFQSSGKQIESKRRRFREPEASKNKRRESALRRVTKGEQYDYLLKTGQLKEEPRRRYRRR